MTFVSTTSTRSSIVVSTCSERGSRNRSNDAALCEAVEHLNSRSFVLCKLQRRGMHLLISNTLAMLTSHLCRSTIRLRWCIRRAPGADPRPQLPQGQYERFWKGRDHQSMIVKNPNLVKISRKCLGNSSSKEFIVESHKSSLERKETDSLERGLATVPLPGINVPYHSRYLWAGATLFRACKCYQSRAAYRLELTRLSTIDPSKKINHADVKPGHPRRKIVLNLNREPFQVARELPQKI